MIKSILSSYYLKLYSIKYRNFMWGAVACLFALCFLLAFLMLKPDNKVFTTVKNELLSLSDNIHKHYQVRPDYWGLNTETAIKNNLIPETLLHNGKVFSSLGKELIIGQDLEGNVVMPASRQFMITIPNIGKSACVGILSLPLEQKEILSLNKITLIADGIVYDFSWGGQLSLPVDTELAKQYCKNHNSVSWVFE